MGRVQDCHCCTGAHRRTGSLGAMGEACSKHKYEATILMVGLDGAGKTTLKYRWAVKQACATQPTTGFDCVKVRQDDYLFTIWDLGGEDKIRALWRHHYAGIDVVVFVVDSGDVRRIKEAANELWMMAQSEELRDARLLVVANKQYLPTAMSVSEVADQLHLHKLEKRQWYIQGASSNGGEGVCEALEWIAFAL